MSATSAARITLYGRVQGVGFRNYVLKEAGRLSVYGCVKNMPDGSVLVVAEGSTANLKAFEKVLKKGPLLASVSSINIENLPPTGEFTSFSVL
ncbi:MAG: acylphosphatase [Dehalococcoidia bacterium]|nr:MAG: acylphosphatase [Dehalococcoidia bacterium]